MTLELHKVPKRASFSLQTDGVIAPRAFVSGLDFDSSVSSLGCENEAGISSRSGLRMHPEDDEAADVDEYKRGAQRLWEMLNDESLNA